MTVENVKGYKYTEGYKMIEKKITENKTKKYINKIYL